MVFSPDLSVGSYYSIFGMAYDGKYIVCDLFNSPNVDTENLMKHDKKAYSVGDDILVGDVNGDGEVLVDDVVLAINCVLGQTDSDFIFEAGDMNSDGEILVDDVVLVINKVLGVTE